MRCAEARAALVELPRGPGPSEPDRALRRHLAHCAACADEACLERLLRRDLGLLRAEMTGEVDVVAEVAGRIGTLGRIEADEIPLHQLGWITLVAVSVVALLLGGLWLLLPDLVSLVGATGTLVRALWATAAGLGSPLLALLGLPLKLAGVLFRALAALGDYATRLEPVGIAVVAVFYGVMTGTITLILRRDLGRPVPLPSARGARGQ